MDLVAPATINGLNVSVTGTATKIMDLINTASNASFTADTFSNLDGVDITPEDGAIRISIHPGLVPTATLGRLLASGITYSFRFKDLANIRAIATTGTVKCSLEVGKSRQGEQDSAGGSRTAP